MLENNESKSPVPANAVKSTLAIGGDEVLLATRELPEDHREAIRWLHAWAMENGLTLKRIEEATKISSTTLYRVWKGQYGAQTDNLVDRINTFRRLVEERGTIGDQPFVQTSVAGKVWKTCEWALVSQSIAIVTGNRGLGKTIALEEYNKTHNHGQTKLVRMPASGGVQLMMREIAKACYLSPKSCFDALRERVLNAIDGNNLLIVDELHQVFLSYHAGSAIKCLEVLREIHDRTHCGMVLVGTTALADELLLGKHKEVLAQFTDRGVLQVSLPKKLAKRDVFKIAKAFGLPGEPDGHAADVLREVLATRSLRKFGKLLQAANRIAHKQQQTVGWQHFAQAHDILARLSLAD